MLPGQQQSRERPLQPSPMLPSNASVNDSSTMGAAGAAGGEAEAEAEAEAVAAAEAVAVEGAVEEGREGVVELLPLPKTQKRARFVRGTDGLRRPSIHTGTVSALTGTKESLILRKSENRAFSLLSYVNRHPPFRIPPCLLLLVVLHQHVPFYLIRLRRHTLCAREYQRRKNKSCRSQLIPLLIWLSVRVIVPIWPLTRAILISTGAPLPFLQRVLHHFLRRRRHLRERARGQK